MPKIQSIIPETSHHAIARQYREGATLQQLAEHYGVSMGAVRRLLLLLGIEMRSPGGRGRGRGDRGPQDPARMREILRLRACGWTLRAIGDRYGISRQSVWQTIARHGRLPDHPEPKGKP